MREKSRFYNFLSSFPLNCKIPLLFIVSTTENDIDQELFKNQVSLH